MKKKIIALSVTGLLIGGTVFALPNEQPKKYEKQTPDNTETFTVDTYKSADPVELAPEVQASQPVEQSTSGGSHTTAQQQTQTTTETETEPDPESVPEPVTVVSSNARWVDYPDRKEQYCDYLYSDGSTTSKLMGIGYKNDIGSVSTTSSC